LNVSAQLALPEWVRVAASHLRDGVSRRSRPGASCGARLRAWAACRCPFFGGGGLAARDSCDLAMEAPHGRGADLTPSMHWPTPVLSHHVESDAGPVLVTVEYRVGLPTAKHFFARWTSCRMSEVATAPTRGSVRRHRRARQIPGNLLSSRGWSICASTSASPMPIGRCRIASASYSRSGEDHSPDRDDGLSAALRVARGEGSRRLAMLDPSLDGALPIDHGRRIDPKPSLWTHRNADLHHHVRQIIPGKASAAGWRDATNASTRIMFNMGPRS